ncbi:uncharacterized protein LOC119095059 [Pollicipes pollicipes]|uniref:uncharacterized protein LOC119095059 n=1 Tax=Pollicipes pollicipes TaxID=41117 RepID=UPI0018851FF2|nr:uncharacterized protein LOC119095059 [Pollicipes pollicipes]
MDMEREVTEEFMNEIWGDLALDLSPFSNDNLTDVAVPWEEPAPAAAAGEPAPLFSELCHLMDAVSDDQLRELYADVEASPPEEPTAAAAEPAAPAEEVTISRSTIDLGALLEETNIVFCDSPPPPPPASAKHAGKRVAELEQENAALLRQVEVLEGLVERVKALAPLLTARPAQ